MLPVAVASALLCSLLGTVVGAKELSTNAGKIGLPDDLSATFTNVSGSGTPKPLEGLQTEATSLKLEPTPGGAKLNGTAVLLTIMAVYDWMAYHIPENGGFFTEINPPCKYGIGINITRTSNVSVAAPGQSETSAVTQNLAWSAVGAAELMDMYVSYVESTGIVTYGDVEFARISIFVAPTPLDPGEPIPSSSSAEQWAPSLGDGGTRTWKRSGGAALQPRGLGPWHYDRSLTAHVRTQFTASEAPLRSVLWAFVSLAEVLLNEMNMNPNRVFFDGALHCTLENYHTDIVVGSTGGSGGLQRQTVEAVLFAAEYQVRRSWPIAANTTFFVNGTAKLYVDVGPWSVSVQ